MKQTEGNTIRLVVNDEQTLYTPLNPETEFSPLIKNYIKTKTAIFNYYHGLNLTVISREPVNEEKFRLAVANWIADEKAVFRKNKRENTITVIALLVAGSILIVWNILLQKRYEGVQYSLLPIMASLALSRAAGILLMDIPKNHAEKQLLLQLEKDSTITFEREKHDQLPMEPGNHAEEQLLLQMEKDGLISF